MNPIDRNGFTRSERSLLAERLQADRGPVRRTLEIRTPS